MLCPIYFQLPREHAKMRNNAKKSPKRTELFLTSEKGGFEFGVKAQALPLCRQLCPSLAVSLCLLLITGNQTDLLVGPSVDTSAQPSAAALR